MFNKAKVIFAAIWASTFGVKGNPLGNLPARYHVDEPTPQKARHSRTTNGLWDGYAAKALRRRRARNKAASRSGRVNRMRA